MNRLTGPPSQRQRDPQEPHMGPHDRQRVRRRRLQPEVEALPDRLPAAAVRRPSATPARLRRARTQVSRSRASRAIRLHDLHCPRPRGGLHHAHVRHELVPYGPRLVDRINPLDQQPAGHRPVLRADRLYLHPQLRRALKSRCSRSTDASEPRSPPRPATRAASTRTAAPYTILDSRRPRPARPPQRTRLRRLIRTYCRLAA
jgi:hypothetical protein